MHLLDYDFGTILTLDQPCQEAIEANQHALTWLRLGDITDAGPTMLGSH